ncbi:urease accessory protein UreF [Corynebacterium variabile]|uniref:urease accessory protein UreF n=1 Tax=Corynebacterium variabile TaxID=1727 RepID=UPI00289C7A43|nr:urease accessory UreF family protein [Corynebacterium variabile]
MTYADSAYPSGRYTLSHGLEGLVQAHRVTGADAVQRVLLDHLRHTAAPGDGVATAAAAGAGYDDLDMLVALDHELSATKVTHELRRASTRVGRQMLQVTADVEARLGQTQPDPLLSYAAAVRAKETLGNQAVVAGLIHASHGLTPAEAVATELTGLAVGWAGAALRLRQCDHIDAQVIITAAHPVIAELAEECVAVASDLLQSGQWRLLGRASPGSDLASAAHETAPARLFMS